MFFRGEVVVVVVAREKRTTTEKCATDEKSNKVRDALLRRRATPRRDFSTTKEDSTSGSRHLATDRPAGQRREGHGIIMKFLKMELERKAEGVRAKQDLEILSIFKECSNGVFNVLLSASCLPACGPLAIGSREVRPP